MSEVVSDQSSGAAVDFSAAEGRPIASSRRPQRLALGFDMVVAKKWVDRLPSLIIQDDWRQFVQEKLASVESAFQKINDVFATSPYTRPTTTTPVEKMVQLCEKETYKRPGQSGWSSNSNELQGHFRRKRFVERNEVFQITPEELAISIRRTYSALIDIFFDVQNSGLLAEESLDPVRPLWEARITDDSQLRLRSEPSQTMLLYHGNNIRLLEREVHNLRRIGLYAPSSTEQRDRMTSIANHTLFALCQSRIAGTGTVDEISRTPPDGTHSLPLTWRDLTAAFPERQDLAGPSLTGHGPSDETESLQREQRILDIAWAVCGRYDCLLPPATEGSEAAPWLSGLYSEIPPTRSDA